MKTRSKYIVGTFVVLGSCIGMTIITPQLNVSQDTGILLGMALGFLTSLLIPNLWRSFLETIYTEHQEAIEQKRYIGFREILTHPTHLPMILGLIWLFMFLTIILVFKLDPYQKALSLLTYIPTLLSIGLSGLIMIRRKELVTGGLFGSIFKKTNWAIVSGLILMMTGFGGAIYFIFAIVLNW